MIYLATIELGYEKITHRHFYYSVENTMYYCKDVHPDTVVYFYYFNNKLYSLENLNNLDKCEQMISPQNIFIIGYYRNEIFTKKLEELAFEKAIFPKILENI